MAISLIPFSPQRGAASVKLTDVLQLQNTCSLPHWLWLWTDVSKKQRLKKQTLRPGPASTEPGSLSAVPGSATIPHTLLACYRQHHGCRVGEQACASPQAIPMGLWGTGHSSQTSKPCQARSCHAPPPPRHHRASSAAARGRTQCGTQGQHAELS